jgi:hypothetical protein
MGPRGRRIAAVASVAAIVLLLASAQGAMAAGSRDVLQRYARDT